MGEATSGDGESTSGDRDSNAECGIAAESAERPGGDTLCTVGNTPRGVGQAVAEGVGAEAELAVAILLAETSDSDDGVVSAHDDGLLTTDNGTTDHRTTDHCLLLTPGQQDN